MIVLGTTEQYQRPEFIMPQMTEIASDPIGAFQYVSDYMVRMAAEIAALRDRVESLEQRPVNSA